jgi:hypothetical protein
VSTGPIPDDVISDLEALKSRLASMAAEDMSDARIHAMAAEIGAIRLQLKRLAADLVHKRREIERRALRQ